LTLNYSHQLESLAVLHALDTRSRNDIDLMEFARFNAAPTASNQRRLIVHELSG
jgi:hypothetical protein